MRNLLQNKVAVACLMAIALVLAGFQLNLFKPSQVFMVTGREAEAEAPADAEEVDVTLTNAPPRYLTGLRDWHQTLIHQTVKRDPFRSPEVPSAFGGVRSPERTNKTSVSLNLQAISQHNDRRFVVVDGSVLGIGDKLAGLEVVQIEPRWVLLRGPEGLERKLELHFEGTSGSGDRAANASDEDSSATPVDPNDK